MSDWKKRNEDWRDEDELEEEEECECPWVDSKGKVRETAYCQYLLEKHPMMCLKQKLFDQKPLTPNPSSASKRTALPVQIWSTSWSWSMTT